MTITNHVLVGSIIGILVKEPAAALVLAGLSHFALDALPHFGYPGNKGYSEALHHKLSYHVGAVTVATTIIIILLLIFKMQWLALATGLVAALPDALGLYNYTKYEKHGLKAGGITKLVHVKFHRAIQRWERPWGIYVEVFVSLLLSWVLVGII